MGEYLGLKVPGLAEGRPSVLLGDKVMLTDPGDPDGPCFEGYAHEVFLVRLNEVQEEQLHYPRGRC